MTSPSPGDLVVIWKADCVAIQGTVQSLETHRTPPETSKKKHLQTMCIFNFVSKCFKTIQDHFNKVDPEDRGGCRETARRSGECLGDWCGTIDLQTGGGRWEENGRFLRVSMVSGGFWLQSQGFEFWWFQVIFGEFGSSDLVSWVFFSKDHRLYLSSRPSPFTVMALVLELQRKPLLFHVVSLCRPNNASNSWALP